ARAPRRLVRDEGGPGVRGRPSRPRRVARAGLRGAARGPRRLPALLPGRLVARRGGALRRGRLSRGHPGGRPRPRAARGAAARAPHVGSRLFRPGAALHREPDGTGTGRHPARGRPQPGAARRAAGFYPRRPGRRRQADPAPQRPVGRAGERGGLPERAGGLRRPLLRHAVRGEPDFPLDPRGLAAPEAPRGPSGGPGPSRGLDGPVLALGRARVGLRLAVPRLAHRLPHPRRAGPAARRPDAPARRPPGPADPRRGRPGSGRADPRRRARERAECRPLRPGLRSEHLRARRGRRLLRRTAHRPVRGHRATLRPHGPARHAPRRAAGLPRDLGQGRPDRRGTAPHGQRRALLRARRGAGHGPDAGRRRRAARRLRAGHGPRDARVPRLPVRAGRVHLGRPAARGHGDAAGPRRGGGARDRPHLPVPAGHGDARRPPGVGTLRDRGVGAGGRPGPADEPATGGGPRPTRGRGAV
ncbi:MAG: hypothetical protein AVDCRST_MAG13-594, partial [uncultured Solirubrobacteraceae bacterium]